METFSDLFLFLPETRGIVAGLTYITPFRCPSPPHLHACTVEGEDLSQVWVPPQPSDED